MGLVQADPATHHHVLVVRGQCRSKILEKKTVKRGTCWPSTASIAVGWGDSQGCQDWGSTVSCGTA